MHRVPPAAITPSHKQVPHIHYNAPWFRIDMYELPGFFDPSTRFTARGARIRDFETTNLVLKEKRHGTKVRVRRVANAFARLKEGWGYGGIVDQT